MRASRATALAWLLWALTLAGTLTEAALRLPSASALAARFDVFPSFPIISVSTVAAATVGAVIVSREPRNPVGWLFCATNCLAQLGLAGAAYAELSLVRHTPLPYASYGTWLEAITSANFALTALVLLFLLFPSGRLPSPRWRVVVWLTGADFLALTTVVLVVVGPPGRALPNYAQHVHGVRAGLLIGLELTLLALLLAATGSLVARRRHARGNERQQLRLVGTAATALGAALVVVALRAPLAAAGVPGVLPQTLFYLAYGALPVTAGLAVLRYRLYDVDVLLGRAVVLGSLAALCTAGYVAVVVTLGAVLGQRIGSGRLVSLVTIAVVAVAVQPGRRHLQGLAARLVHGERAAPYDVLASFTRRLGSTLSVDDVLPAMAVAAAKGVGAPAATVHLTLADGGSRHSRWPEGPPGVPDVVVPVEHATEVVGGIALELRPGEELDRAGRALLADLARQAGLVLKSVRLTAELRDRLQEIAQQNEELEASRSRLLLAQVLERQRLEQRIGRDVQPHLRTISAGVTEVSTLLQDPVAAGAVVGRMSAAATDALEVLREVARGVFPPLLVDRGLPAALRAAAGAARVPLELDVVGELRRCGAGPEAAVYFCSDLLLGRAVATGGGLHLSLACPPDALELTAPGSALPLDLLEAVRDRVAGSGGTAYQDAAGLRVVLPAPTRPPAQPEPVPS